MADIPDSNALALEDGLEDATAKYVNRLFRRGMKTIRKQHEAFKDADLFVGGDQWPIEDAAKLNAENRPVAVFNFTKRHINIICGVQILNNLQPTFIPRVIDSEQSAQLAELATGAHDFVMQACDGYYEIASAFRDLAIRGAGFVMERLDMIDEPGGKIIWERIDGRHLVWDPDARKQNLEDSRYWVMFAKVPKKEAANEWPEHAEYILSGAAADADDIFGTSAKVEQVVPPVYDPINKYETDAIDSSDRDHVILKQAYWYEDEKWFDYIDPFEPDKGIQEKKASEFRKMRREIETLYPDANIEGAEKTKRVWKRAFVIGRRTMEETDSPVQKGSPICAMTGDWDEKEKLWVGVPAVIKQPNQFLNKYLSQTMHAVATTPRGILLHEDGAFDNITMAEEQWAQWAPFIAMSPGALGGPGGQGKKFEYLPPGQVPSIYMEMWTKCIEVISQISGISQELLTGGEGEVPGITMRQRQQVAMISMAGLFSSYRRFLEKEAIITLEQIQKFYMDDRIVRIGGQYDGQAVQLAQWKDKMLVPMDIFVDENPRNPNTADQRFEMLTQSGILPGLFKTGAIMQMPALINSFPIDAESKAQMRKWVTGMASQLQPGQIPGQKPPKQEKQSARDNPQLIQAQIQHRQAQTQLTQMKTQESKGKFAEAMAKARALDAQAKGHKLQSILDVMAMSIEKEQKDREHRLAVAGHQADIHHKHLELGLSAMGMMNQGAEA